MMRVSRAVAFAGVVAVFGAQPAARGQQVLFERYEMPSSTGQLSALCVAVAPRPGMTVAPANPPFLCYYIIAGGEKSRDNTNGNGGTYAPKTSPDTAFADWLATALGPVATRCRVPDLLAGQDLPVPETLKQGCPSAIAEESAWDTGNTSPLDGQQFIRRVREEVEKRIEQASAALPANNTTSTSTAGDDKKKDEKKLNEYSAPAQEDNKEPAWYSRALRYVMLPVSFLLSLLRSVSAHPLRLLAALLTLIFAGTTFLVVARIREDRKQAAQKLLSGLDDLRRKVAAMGDNAKFRERVDALLGGNATAPADAVARIESLLGKIRSIAADQAGDLEAVLCTIETKTNQWRRIESLVGDRAPEAAEQYVTNAVQLAERFQSDFWEQAGPELAADALSDFEKEVNGLYDGYGLIGAVSGKARLSSLKEEFKRRADEDRDQRQLNAEALAVLERVKRKALDDEKAPDTIDRLIRDLGAAQDFIVGEWHVDPNALSSSIPEIQRRFRDAKGQAMSMEVPGDDMIEEMVNRLASQIRSEREAAKAMADLVRKLRGYLDLPNQASAELAKMTVYEFGKPHRLLRLCLAAAIPELKRSAARLPDSKAAPLIRLLGQEGLIAPLEGFLSQLGTYQDDRLWQTGLQSGFSQHWLHRLFRAEALLTTYYTGAEYGAVTDLVSILAGAFRAGAKACGVEIDRVQLLTQPPAGIEIKRNPEADIQSAPLIRARVQEMLNAQKADGFVVDVDVFGYRRGNDVLKASRLVLANFPDWTGGAS